MRSRTEGLVAAAAVALLGEEEEVGAPKLSVGRMGCGVSPLLLLLAPSEGLVGLDMRGCVCALIGAGVRVCFVGGKSSYTTGSKGSAVHGPQTSG